ncbi:MAG: heparinase II/III family protein [Clostridia bacterium]|nr:heparinase II/III family protein [Clostridia bacterium]
MLDFALDKKLWEKVRNSDEFAWHRKEIKELYEKAFTVEPRAHSAEEILNNNDNGLWRLQFDHLQSAALMALIYPENEEYYNNLLKIVWAYLNEYAWAPLGHYTEYYYGKTPKDFDNGLIDIFAASAGFALAEVKNLFKDRFPRLLQDRISHEIKRHIIDPYKTRKFFWESHDNNWTAVCAGAVGGTLIYEDPDAFFENQERLHKSMECYLASYKNDGMCVEGVGYWYFGFGFFASYAMLEREITNGEVDWFKNPKIKEISKFLQKTFLLKDVLVTFSDSSVKQKYFIGLHQMLRTVYGDEIERLPKELGQVVYDNTHFNFALRSVIYHSEDNFTDKMAINITYSVEDSAYLIKRTDNYGFACKGGNNGESHNHIDVGTFIIARNGKQIICDIGAGPYEDGYHTDRRYTFFHPSAYAHNLPILDGITEDGIRRDDVIVHYDWDNEIATMDIKAGYGVDFINSLQRSFDFEDSKITLTDKFYLTKDVEKIERFISLIEPKIEGSVAVIDDVSLVNAYGIAPKISVKEVKAHIGGAHNVYMLDYILPKEQKEFTIEFKM